MIPNWVDHVWGFVLVAVLPLYATLDYQRFVQELAGGEPNVRAREYRHIIGLEWALVAAFVLTWLFVQQRAATALGLTIIWGTPGVIGAIVTVVGLLAIAAQIGAVKGLQGAQLDGLRAQMARVSPILPATPQEFVLFRWLSVTAGICEELLYRGFLLWYLAAYVGTWPAVGLGAVAFGVGHAYQGMSGIIKTGIVGALAGALYVTSGSLIWPMLLHAAVDLQAGVMVRLVRERSNTTAPTVA
ncbi:MAG: type II CAAX endopeptidase family protein [Gemmatimonadota bacterium]